MEAVLTRTGDRWNYGWTVACESIEQVEAVLGIAPRGGVIWIPGWAGCKAVSQLRSAGFTVVGGPDA